MKQKHVIGIMDMFEIVEVEIDEPKSNYFGLGTSKHIINSK
jgi:hypothetical protein